MIILENVRVLEEIVIKGAPTWVIILTIFLLLFGLVAICTSDGDGATLVIGFVILFIGLGLGIYCVYAGCKRPTGEVRYKILVDDVDNVDFLQYEIYEQEGDIITIRERE